jgi:hypothetical protein
MIKISAIILCLSLVSMTWRSEAKTKYLEQGFSFVPSDNRITNNNHQINVDRPLVLTQAQGLQASEIEGIYIHLEYGYGNGITIEYTPYLLLKDGSIYKNLSSSLSELDVASSKQTEAKNWGTWQINGATLNIQWNDGESEAWDDNWFKAVAAQTGDSLSGNYQSLSLGGNTSVGGDVMTAAYDNISFLPNGEFSQTTGAGGSTDSVATNSQDSATGTYKLDNYTIEFRYHDGRVVEKTFYFYPQEGGKTDETIGIGGSSFVKED